MGQPSRQGIAIFSALRIVAKHKDGICPDLDSLLQIEKSYMIDKPEAKITFLDPVRRHDGVRTVIRCYQTTMYPGPEFSGFVDFDKFHTLLRVVLSRPARREEPQKATLHLAKSSTTQRKVQGSTE